MALEGLLPNQKNPTVLEEKEVVLEGQTNFRRGLGDLDMPKNRKNKGENENQKKSDEKAPAPQKNEKVVKEKKDTKEESTSDEATDILKDENHPFYKASKTAKVSADVLLKLRTIRSFVVAQENLENDTNNDILNAIIDKYAQECLSEEQRKEYNHVYNVYLGYERKR